MSLEDLVLRTDLERENVEEILEILNAEFESKNNYSFNLWEIKKWYD